MSESSTPAQGESQDPRLAPNADVLKFSCTNCGKLLTAPRSAAGVVAPCPTCGATTQAPELPVDRRSIAPKPRQFPPQATAPAPTQPVAGVPSMPAPGDPSGQIAPTLDTHAAPTPAHAPAATGQTSLSETAAVGQTMEAPQQPLARRRQRRASGAIDPVTGLSAVYQDRKEAGALIRIVLAVALTAGIAIGVFFFVQKKISEPPPPPAPTRGPAP